MPGSSIQIMQRDDYTIDGETVRFVLLNMLAKMLKNCLDSTSYVSLVLKIPHV